MHIVLVKDEASDRSYVIVLPDDTTGRPTIAHVAEQALTDFMDTTNPGKWVQPMASYIEKSHIAIIEVTGLSPEDRIVHP